MKKLVRERKENPSHDVFVRGTEAVAAEESWRSIWMRKGYLKKETEGMTCAAQQQALRTNSVMIKSTNHLCVDCAVYESVWHIVSGGPKLAQKEYRKRHDKVAPMVHWELCLESGEKWYQHQPLHVVENDLVKLIWDTTIITDKRMQHIGQILVSF